MNLNNKQTIVKNKCNYGMHYYHVDEIKEHPLTGDLLVIWYCPLCKKHNNQIMKRPTD